MRSAFHIWLQFLLLTTVGFSCLLAGELQAQSNIGDRMRGPSQESASKQSGAQGTQNAQDDGEEEGDSKKIDLIQADELIIENDGAINLRRLIGNVILKQGDVLLECDSAIQYPDENMVRSYGNVHISQGDTVHAYGDSLRYDGDKKIAKMTDNVRLEDRGMTLSTDNLSYDLDGRTAVYRDGGRLDNGETILTSKKGYYYAKSGTAFFKDSVELKNPDYALEADTLEYDINADYATFHGPTTIHNQENTVYCEGGYYDGKALEAVFRGNALLEDPPKKLWGDSIYYDRKTGYGQAWGNVRFEDSLQQVVQSSEYAEYYAETNTILATDRNILSYMIGEDSIFISGDTIRTWVDSLSKRQMLAYGNVRIFKSDMQGVCDSMLYTDTDSSINLYGRPALWTDSSQFTADTMHLMLKNQQLNRIMMRHNGFIANEADSLVYNQIKGRNIVGHMREKELHRMDVDGNGESVYYARDEAGAYLGMNRIKCSIMKIYLAGSEVSRISSRQQPDGEFKPMKGLNLAATMLDGFNWRVREKPLSPLDLHRKTKTAVGSPAGLTKGGGTGPSLETELDPKAALDAGSELDPKTVVDPGTEFDQQDKPDQEGGKKNDADEQDEQIEVGSGGKL